MSDLDDEELIATRKLNGLDDGLYESDKNVASDEIDLTTVYMKGYADAEEKYRQKIKDKIEELKKHYNTDNNIRIYTLKDSYELQATVLEELLEEK